MIPSKKSNQTRLLFIGLCAILGVMILSNFMSEREPSVKEVQWHEFLQHAQNPKNEQQKLVEVVFQDTKVTGTLANKEKISSTISKEIIATSGEELAKLGVLVGYKDPEKESALLKFIGSILLPAILFLGLLFILMRTMQAGGGKALSFGKSRAKMTTKSKPKITFKDIAGIDESKQELQEIIDFLKEPKKFTRLGGRIPKGVILIGPPGTGKTILAKGVAGEAEVPFFSISGSDFVEMFVGVGASRVRDLFDQAKKNAPCIVFIDEIDAVGRHRGAGLGGGHDEREQTLNQLLVEMDGFEANTGVIIIAATNRPDVLDPALLRPGRFDRRVEVPPPDVKGRRLILEVHSRKSPLADDVDLSIIAQGTPGFTGADLENLINEAALIGARRDASEITMADIEEAKDKILMGHERKTMVMGEKEKKNTAYHEAGHALVGLLTDGCDPVHKVTIIPRGRALGVTIMLPKEDRFTMSKTYAEGFIMYAMGGRAAEELMFNMRTSGASDDIQKATDIANKMVRQWGMSEVIGPRVIGKKEEDVFVGRSVATHEHVSEKTAQIVDSEVENIITSLYDKTLKLLRDNKEKLVALAEALVIKESLSSEEMARILKGQDVVSEEEHATYQKRLEQDKKRREGKLNHTEETAHKDEADKETSSSNPVNSGLA